MTMADEPFCDLTKKSCKPCEGGVPPLSDEDIRRFLAQLSDWEYADGKIGKIYRFNDYYQTMAFVNVTAWVSHREDHHPDMEVGYNQCRMRYHTHAINGLSENDFICAAKIDALLNV